MTDKLQLPVLIVEDDEPTRKLLHAVLCRAGFPTQFASHGAEAIELLGASSYAAIVLDLMLPHVGGVDVIDHLARTGSRVPVVVCSAAGPALLESLDRTIARVIIRKPFDVVELMQAVTGVAIAGTRSVRAVIVDDDAGVRYTLRVLLEPAEVVEAESGEQAIPLIRETRPDVILLDLNLPGARGEEILRQLHQDEETRSIPVIVVTSQVLSAGERAALLDHAAALIDKRDLSRDTIREALAAARSTRP